MSSNGCAGHWHAAKPRYRLTENPGSFKYENNFQLKKLISDRSIFVSDVLRQKGTPFDEHDNVELKKPSSCQHDFLKG
jgi:hypothetical protein